MNPTTILEPAEYRKLNSADRKRVNAARLDLLLSYASVAKMSNGKIAAKYGVPIYAVQRHRRLMQQRGSLGVIPGDEVVVLPRIQNKTDERLDDAADVARDLLRMVHTEELASDVAPLLENALRLAEAMNGAKGLPIAVVAGVCDLIERLNCLVDDEIAFFLAEIEKHSAAAHVERYAA